MTWTPLAERLDSLPLILAGPQLRRTEPHAVTVWLALKEPRTVSLHVYTKNEQEDLVQCLTGSHHTIRLGDHLHLVAVTARPLDDDQPLAWGHFYYYDLSFQAQDEPESHLTTPGILVADPATADPLHLLRYPGHPLSGFVLPAGDVSQLNIMHGSCRKPHGIGREMLSTLDTLLETAATADGEDHSYGQRPQQLFLTGDQIYADDVAAPLLFALSDAGCCLFAGNEEESLPLLHAPARTLPPDCRTATVRKGRLTTSTPQNHLLALAEYAAMYLFAWSDTLWPEELPDSEELWRVYPQARPEAKQEAKVRAEHRSALERLTLFRQSLPKARRALANIATYMICDDHEITDDWYLDGDWCRHVMSNPLGRRVIRNGILAYALFQAWGNTPEQFTREHGRAFLQALDAWRGNASSTEAETINALIGMPAAFKGRGELQRSKHALHWHYSYHGPNYQILVMDTRTRRLYRSPDDFPGLLSPHAMQTQLVAPASEDAEVTLIISATPVLGVDFVESVQFWSHWRVRDNYSYDREAWALEWGTFQRLLKTISDLKRVLFLSGDVHYAFGASLEYWDHRTKATAKLVNYTSSSICNEGAGSQIAVLAVGYPRLLHLLRRHQETGVDFFAWDIVPEDHQLVNYMLTIIRRRLYRFWWAIPRLIAARRSPYEIIFPAHGWLRGVFDPFPPNRSYRLRYLRNTLYKTSQKGPRRHRLSLSQGLLKLIRFAARSLALLQTIIGRFRGRLERRIENREQSKRLLHHSAQSLRQEAVEEAEEIERKLERRQSRLIEFTFRYEQWLSRWKASELIIGYNNIGQISFEWSTDKKEVFQRLWWHHPDQPERLLNTDYGDSLALPRPEDEPLLP